MTESAALVAELEARIQPLERAVNEAWWNANTDATEPNEQLRIQAEMALSDALADASAFAAVRDARGRERGATADPMIDRQLALLEYSHLPQQVPGDLRHRIVELQSRVEAAFARHRGTIDGEPVDDNGIARVLRTSDDAGLRRAAWEASKTVGAEVAARVREIATLRNEAAQSLGYRDHFALALATTEFDEPRLFDMLDDVDRVTAEPFRLWKNALDQRLSQRFSCDARALAPWHYDDPFFQSPPVAAAVNLDAYFEAADLESLTAGTFDGLGIDVDPISARSDLLPRPGKNQHAFCIDVDRGGDVRVLCNNEPNEQWAETMLHEFGHGVYFAGVDGSLPWLLRTMHMLTTEGIAMLCGRLVREPEWLRDLAGVSPDEVERLAPRLAEARRSALLVFARWVLVMTNFERGFYADPTADHDTRWWGLVEKFQGIRCPDERHAPDWAAKIHIAAAPVYYHNYLYGELVASQVLATLRSECGGMVGRVSAGRLLAERVFRPGASLRWDHLIEAATGSQLTPASLAADLRTDGS